MKLVPDVETWLRRVVGPKRFRGLDLKAWKEMRKVTTMLEERARQWEKESLARGRAAGVEDGIRSVFRKQFRLRFQRELSESEETRLCGADQDELERLVEAILAAESPSSLFSVDPA